MERSELEHIIRASAEITQEYEFVIIGSQSILGQYPHAPDLFKASAEADIYPLKAPELADLIDAGIGEGSPFHDAYGYYAQGVGPETAWLPRGWFERVHRVQSDHGTNGFLGLCLDVTDLFMSKAVAAREKDRQFCIALLQHDYVPVERALALVTDMPIGEAEAAKLRARIMRWSREAAADVQSQKPAQANGAAGNS
jgi:hypothetical protein